MDLRRGASLEGGEGQLFDALVHSLVEGEKWVLVVNPNKSLGYK